MWKLLLYINSIRCTPRNHLPFLPLNFGKCKFLYTGHGNEDAQYTMRGIVLNTIVKENDLRLTISADMKVSEKC